MKNLTSLEVRVQKVIKANGLKDAFNKIGFAELFKVQNLYMDVYKNEIKNNGIAMKNELAEIAIDVIIENKIPMMPYGHAIISESRIDLSYLFEETSNSYK
tara:strand:+ start:983 stop:1285 length:303 start_codon:yes stop_codon:yes gene_type:complete